ncbi:hypothetical protein [Rhizobium jaguaris]|uniref:hypothetical protein n=1 Tax=Rhizobium jaguaris TaxID=1312183 RepID=UPI0013C4F631|nr:hypothetical protein [Rhizobium jaguaris]
MYRGTTLAFTRILVNIGCGDLRHFISPLLIRLVVAHDFQHIVERRIACGHAACAVRQACRQWTCFGISDGTLKGKQAVDSAARGQQCVAATVLIMPKSIAQFGAVGDTLDRRAGCKDWEMFGDPIDNILKLHQNIASCRPTSEAEYSAFPAGSSNS